MIPYVYNILPALYDNPAAGAWGQQLGEGCCAASQGFAFDKGKSFYIILDVM